jgi:hypothetical protein
MLLFIVCYFVSLSVQIFVLRFKGVKIILQAVRLDRRAIPRTGERVPYVVVYGEPGLPLIQAPQAAILNFVAAILN